MTVVQNPSQPVFKGSILSLKEDWTVGGAGTAGAALLAKPWCLAVDGDGRVYVLDIQDACVRVYDGNGAYVRTIGRRGQGPGEIGAAFSIVIPARSKTLVFNDVGGRRLSFFSLDGVFEKSIAVKWLAHDPVIDSAFAIYLGLSDVRSRRESLKKMNPDLTSALTEFFEEPSVESHDPFRARTRWVLNAEDQLIVGRAASYELDIYDPQGVLVRKIRRDCEPVKVAKSDIDEFLKRGAPPGFTPTYDFSSHHAFYRSFFADDEGHLFVQTWEKTADGAQDIHDIFDAEGRFIGRAAMPRHEDLINPTVRVLRKGRFYAIQPDAEGNSIVKRYSVTWLAPGGNVR